MLKLIRLVSFVVGVLGISFFGGQSSASSVDYSCTISVYDSGVTVLGTDAADVICVFGDNNTVDGLAGNDVVIDEGLNNTINLGPGDDLYDGSNGECGVDGSGVTVTGGDGDDTLIGTPCDDELTGGDGGDSIIAGEGVDVLDGGSGDDELSGGFGDDELLGQPGSDVLDGGVGDDILIGGQDVDDLDGGIGLNVCDYTTTEVRTITCTYDDVGPEFLAFSVSPDVVDVGVSDQSFGISAVLVDATDVKEVQFHCPESLYVRIHFNYAGQSASGYNYDGVSYTHFDMTPYVTFSDGGRKVTIDNVPGKARFGMAPTSGVCSAWVRDSLNNSSIPSQKPSFTVLRTPPGLPQAPSGLGFVSGVGRPFEGVLSWVAPGWMGLPVLFDYEVQVSRDGGPWVVLSDAVTDGTSLSLSNLRPGSVYEFRVRGENGGNQVAGSLGAPWSEVLRVVLPSASVPDVPDGVVVDSVWSSGVVVDWVSPYDGGAVITDYVVEVSADAGVSWSVVPHVVSSASSMTVTGLRAGGSYLVRVAAVNSVGVSEFAVVGFVTPATVPDVPGGVRVSDVSSTGVLLVWDAGFNGGSAITDYVVEVSADAGVSWSVVPHDPFVSQAFRVSGLTRATGYVFRVAAVNRIGVSGFSVGVDVVTLPSLPSAPRGLSVSDVSADGAVLGWVAPSDDGGSAISDYVVELSADAGVTWSVVSDVVSPVTGVTLTGLDALREYQVRVAAVTSVGVSPVLRGSFTTAAEVPSTIYNLAVTQSTKTTVKVTWDHPDADAGRPVTDYVVERSHDGVNFVEVRHTPFVTNQFTYTQLNPGTRYWFRIAAKNEGGVGEYSEIISHVTVGNPPAAPTGLAVRGSGTTVTLSWRAATVREGSPVRDYLVEYSFNGTTWLSVTKPVSTSTSLTIRNLTSKTTYHFRIKAINDVGTSQASKTIKIKTK